MTKARGIPAESPGLVGRPDGLTMWAGRLLIAIAAAHLALFAPQAPWSRWFAGDLRGNGPKDSSVAELFWALPGGFVVVLVLLGLLVGRAGRQGHQVPWYVGWLVLGWSLSCVALIGPSGFVFGVLPAGLLIAADITARRRLRTNG